MSKSFTPGERARVNSSDPGFPEEEKDGEPYNVTHCGLDRLEPPSDPGEG